MPCLSLSLKFHYLARIISYFWPFDVIFRNKIPGKLKPPRHRFLSLSWMSISQQKTLFFILHNFPGSPSIFQALFCGSSQSRTASGIPHCSDCTLHKTLLILSPFFCKCNSYGILQFLLTYFISWSAVKFPKLYRHKADTRLHAVQIALISQSRHNSEVCAHWYPPGLKPLLLSSSSFSPALDNFIFQDESLPTPLISYLSQ